MGERTVLLVDVDGSYGRVLESWSKRRNGRLVRFESELPATPPGNPCLCVVGISPHETDALPRVRGLINKLGAVPVVVIGEKIGVRLAVDLMQIGVADVIELPLDSTEVAARAFRYWVDTPVVDGDSGALVGDCPSVQRLRHEIASAASMRSTVLILGETGTGKGLVARMIHDLSKDRARPFVHVDCAALSPGLIESELFGHERGAFTGATERRAGRFELADRGTIFLDEIGDLDGALQAKLLRVLQDHCFERVGGSRTMTMRARVIAATSRDLGRAVRDGRFRRDLYFRLNVLQLKISPLRERLQDIPLLVRHGLHHISARLGVPEPAATDQFYARLGTHSWPGNVRELLNALERCLVHRRVDLLDAEDLDDLFEQFGGDGDPTSDDRRAVPDVALLEGEEETIRSALLSTGGNVSRVARRLGMPRTTLRRRIREYGLKHLIPSD